MRRILGFTIFALLLSLGAAGAASATTYYIAANGSDSNNGTTKTTPWLHAPGMANCAGTCNSATINPGDSVIFRGGDTWHFAASTAPAIGGSWAFPFSGSSGHFIYIGVDKTWFTGASWVRPIINFDNPTSTAVVSSCTYNYGSSPVTGINLGGSNNYITFDNFELTGMCTISLSPTMLNLANTYNNVSNNYFHGWTGNSTAQVFLMYGNNTNVASFDVISGNVFDGSDAHCVAANDCQGWLSYGEGYDFHQNIVRYIANGLNPANDMYTIHDNLFEYIYESSDPAQHTGVLEGGDITGSPMYIYNNIFRHLDAGLTVSPEPYQNLYIFNNVFFDIGNPGNCLNIDRGGTSAASLNVYFYNNTVDNPCTLQFYGQHSGQQFNGNGYFENNHYIGSSPAALSSTYSITGSASATITDNGGELFQTEAVANTQGYVPGNNYAPASTGGATVTASGGDLTASCSAFSPDGSLCSGTSGGASEAGGPLAAYPAVPIVPRPTSGFWNAGAYQFNLSSAGQPNPPTGLTAAVQ